MTNSKKQTSVEDKRAEKVKRGGLVERSIFIARLGNTTKAVLQQPNSIALSPSLSTLMVSTSVSSCEITQPPSGIFCEFHSVSVLPNTCLSQLFPGSTGSHYVAQIFGPVLLHPAYHRGLSSRLPLDPTQSPSRYVVQNFSEPHRGNFFVTPQRHLNYLSATVIYPPVAATAFCAAQTSFRRRPLEEWSFRFNPCNKRPAIGSHTFHLLIWNSNLLSYRHKLTC
ncbi:uncharacterized protein HD556DRAFT_894515 [Suillus plorans]|uniref:Uncharacterized protein n=1 Tax=Suillus plorans TaxID=116603 RepID=A0A9P7DS16_9AGAM|nr:uncharacterized protein HD556DRAFT_894515 [Suillus plorans]KAG1801618.1 hypothetical protein HD556DRAFT_894515 [Suillus plorans]